MVSQVKRPLKSGEIRNEIRVIPPQTDVHQQMTERIV